PATPRFRAGGGRRPGVHLRRVSGGRISACLGGCDLPAWRGGTGFVAATCRQGQHGGSHGDGQGGTSEALGESVHCLELLETQRRTSSTRRLAARPAGVSLLATGASRPSPRAVNRPGSMPRSTRASTTA